MASPADWNRVVLRTVQFEPDGSVVIEYCIPAKDARENGVVLNHIMSVPYGQDYDDEIDAVHDAALELISDVLEDLPNLAPIRPPQPREERDDDGDDDEDDDDADDS